MLSLTKNNTVLIEFKQGRGMTDSVFIVFIVVIMAAGLNLCGNNGEKTGGTLNMMRFSLGVMKDIQEQD